MGEFAVIIFGGLWFLFICALIIAVLCLILDRFRWFITSSLPEKYRDGKIAPKMDANYNYIDDEESVLTEPNPENEINKKTLK
jgi:hypothetical protein